ncbi:MAG TPA: hypothetical protein VII99_06365 [Bacteroidia bacterium]
MKKIILWAILSLIVWLKAVAQDVSSKTSEVGLVFTNLNSFGFRYKCGNDKTLFRLTVLSLSGSNTNGYYSNYSNLGTNAEIPTNPSSSLGAGLNAGIERRNRINETLYFLYGLDLINSWSESKSNTTTPSPLSISYVQNNVEIVQTAIVNNTLNSKAWTINTGLGIVVGVACKINNAFNLSAELIPSVSYKYTQTTTTNTTYSVRWIGNSTTGYTPSPFLYGNSTQTVLNKGLTYGLTNTAASITLAYKIK